MLPGVILEARLSETWDCCRISVREVRQAGDYINQPSGFHQLYLLPQPTTGKLPTLKQKWKAGTLVLHHSYHLPTQRCRHCAA